MASFGLLNAFVGCTSFEFICYAEVFGPCPSLINIAGNHKLYLSDPTVTITSMILLRSLAPGRNFTYTTYLPCLKLSSSLIF
jgi:hypothetical protein